MEEVWKAIPEMEHYEASSLGRIRSLKGKGVVLSQHLRGGKILYLCVSFNNKASYVHRLIATAFIANPDSLPCVRHLDDDQFNNVPSNLLWGTHTDNMNDKLKVLHTLYDKHGKAHSFYNTTQWCKDNKPTMAKGFGKSHIDEVILGTRKSAYGYTLNKGII